MFRAFLLGAFRAFVVGAFRAAVETAAEDVVAATSAGRTAAVAGAAAAAVVAVPPTRAVAASVAPMVRCVGIGMSLSGVKHGNADTLPHSSFIQIFSALLVKIIRLFAPSADVCLPGPFSGASEDRHISA
ncbi:hypothetical protein [Thermopolyspora flexuosa]|uniref:hypothetical protein n=1 Tax=Thermopolyspora flexuosa TaxID=103836 RepID=UPI001E52C819|nr:hypothetical protein [Thermopolyspora flexuosa]